MAIVRAGIQCPTVGTVTGAEHPAPRANGTADGFRDVRGRMVLLAGGLAVRGRGSLLTGCGVQAAAPLITRSPIGEGRLGAGVIRSSVPGGPNGNGSRRAGEKAWGWRRRLAISPAVLSQLQPYRHYGCRTRSRPSARANPGSDFLPRVSGVARRGRAQPDGQSRDATRSGDTGISRPV